jgi:organic hydroperoxide reductase OsmC/OhrA
VPHPRTGVKTGSARMSEHRIELDWLRNNGPFARGNYSTVHEITFSESLRIKGSPSPEYGGDNVAADPEQMFVASVSACHMLTFLAVAANRGYVVDTYHDNAVATLEKNAQGQMVITRVVLKPKVNFSGEKHPAADDYRKLHERAHSACFIANSVKSEVVVDV